MAEQVDKLAYVLEHLIEIVKGNVALLNVLAVLIGIWVGWSLLWLIALNVRLVKVERRVRLHRCSSRAECGFAADV